MPAQHQRRVRAKPQTPRAQTLPNPGIGGYDYPRGPYGKTGFPGSTPASKRTKGQTAESRRDRQLTATQIQERDTGPEFTETWPTQTPKPQPSYGEVRFRPGTEADPGNRFIRPNGTPRQPRARQHRSTSAEHRMTPVIGGAPGSQNVRNEFAQRYKARPELVREYRASPNPGKTGARFDGPSRYHPDVFVHGHPDGKPVPAMAPQPGYPPTVVVQSRFVSEEGSQEGYAMDRPMLFSKGGTPARQPTGAAPHIRGGRFDGTRYFGALEDQQKIGLKSDSYGIKRARGPNHRPVRFEQPPPWTANFYDVPPDQGETAPDMIRRAPAAPRRNSGTPRSAVTGRGRRGRG